MFDWDRDCEADTARRSLPAMPETNAPPTARPDSGARSGGLSGTSPRWMGPVAAALLMAMAWQAGSTAHLGATMPVSLAAFGALPPGAVGADAAPPPTLAVYEPRQVGTFQSALARFADADLILFANQTRAALGDPADPMTPYQTDALALIDHEIARRGLTPPGPLR